MTKIWFQFWHDRKNVPPVVKKNFLCNQKVHGDYTCVLADDQSMCRFISRNYDGEILNLYVNNRIPASRCDIARVMLTFHFGGIYLDASYRCLSHLHAFLRKQLPDRRLILARRGPGLLNQICNGLIVAQRRRDPILKKILEQIISNTRSGVFNNDVWEATGAGVFRQVLEKEAHKEGVSFVNLDLDLLDYCLIKDSNFEQKNSWVQEQNLGIYRER